MATARRPRPSPPSSLPAPGAAEHVWVGRFAIVGGEVQEHGPWLADRLCVRDEDEIRLLVLAEPADERSAQFCPEVAEAVTELFARESLSLTGGLLRAIRTAHLNLAEWNRRSLREHRVAVGLTCVAIRDGVATLAQVGAGLAYLYDADGFRRFSTEDSEAVHPIGGEETVEPLFHAVPLEGRQLLMMTSGAEAMVGAQAVGESLARGPERALAELFLRSRGVPEMTAVLIADLDLPEPSPPPPVVQRQAEPSGRWRVLQPAPVPDADPDAEPDAEPDGAPAYPVRRRDRRGARDARGGRERRRARRDARPLLQRRIRTPGGAEVPWWWVAVAALVLTLAAVAVAVLPGRFAEDRRAALDAAIVEAGGYLAAAREATDPAQRRAAFVSALDETERAASIDPDDPRVAALEATARAGLADLNAVVEVGEMQELISFTGTIGPPFDPQSIAVGGGWLWLLDTAGGRVIRVDPGGSADPNEVYRTGQRYGGVEARSPLAMTWEAESRRLLVLDESRTLFVIDPGNPQPQARPLRDAGDIASVAALATYAGNLYVLDPEDGEVWRYLPAGDGFDSERAGLLGGLDIEGASGLWVDGDVFILGGSTLHRFKSGEEGAPMLHGIDRPLDSPAAVVEDSVRGLLYVADGNDRVVVGDREGAFVRQFTHNTLNHLRGLALSQDGETLYVLTAGGIVAFDPVAEAGEPQPE